MRPPKRRTPGARIGYRLAAVNPAEVQVQTTLALTEGKTQAWCRYRDFSYRFPRLPRRDQTASCLAHGFLIIAAPRACQAPALESLARASKSMITERIRVNGLIDLTFRQAAPAGDVLDSIHALHAAADGVGNGFGQWAVIANGGRAASDQ